jgi:prefoldin beta subunit
MRRDLVEFQNLQQQLQLVLMQRQQTQLQLAELEKAQEEIAKGEGKFFRFAGSILVPKEKNVLQKELKEEKESLELRQSVVGKQEEKLKERLNALRKKFEEFEKKSGGLGAGEGAKVS